MKKILSNKYFLYSVCFWGFIGPLIYYISSLGLCTIGTSDAVSQIYPIMLYVRRLLVRFFDALLQGERFTYPMVDFTLGMGDDTIAALNWHGLGDPFYLLTIFSSEQNLPYFYSVLFYLRVYLGGAAFIAFVSELDHNKSTGAYVIGALVYCFTGFTLQSNMHVIFTHAMLYIPLLMLGAEKSIHGKKKGILCAATFCFALSGFYFLYIGSVSLAVYVIYRMFREKRALKEALIKIRTLIVEYVVGLGLAAVIFIPAVIGFLSSDRTGVESGYPLISSWTSIKHFLKNMFLPSYDTEQELAVCTIGMIVLVCVLLAQKRKQEKINLALLFLIVIIPFFSCMMSGFGECYERWQLVIDLYIAFLVFSLWDELSRISVVQKAGVALVYLLLLFVGKRDDILEHERFRITILSYGLILLMLVVVLPIFQKFKKEKLGKYLLFAVVYLTVCMNWKVVARDRDIDQVQGRQVVAELLGDTRQGAFYRIDNERGFAEPRLGMNISLSQDYYGTMEYVSIENNHYIYAFEKWDISHKDHNVAGLDQRAVLETMCAVKYFVVRTENESIVPYGFTYVKSTADGEWSLYENQYALPIAYAYDQIFDAQTYQEMSGLEKQEVMLQAAAAEAYEGTLPKMQWSGSAAFEGAYTITETEGVVLEDDHIKAKAGDTMVLSAELKDGCENYLMYTGQKRVLSGMELQIEEGYTKYCSGISPLLINLGTVPVDKTVRIKMNFKKETEFDKSELQLMHFDLSDYAQAIEAMSKDTQGRFMVATNRISGTVDLDRDKLLCFSVPYAKGWHAMIDGEHTAIYPVNDMFMGVDSTAGEHEIVLYYVTPGIRIGAGISIISLFVVLVYGFRQVRERKKRG